ncbi:hypothetical protein GBF38_003091 [Nibea albiflora]|uniref:Uncharacterized protein n=1 Tax=Nibea albiflora TaxID=240163 RepID=A0ACB7FJV9_NIBAL|nr:hypothetical protein GBF38_003091 [Nibea albiflora]
MRVMFHIFLIIKNCHQKTNTKDDFVNAYSVHRFNMLGRRSEDDDVDLDENLSNQYSQIDTTTISEFQGVVTFPSSGRKPLLLLLLMMMKRPSGYKHYLLHALCIIQQWCLAPAAVVTLRNSFIIPL